MFPLSRNFLKFAAAGALVALTAATTPASADDMMQNLGPVGPQEPILITVGGKHIIAFYAPSNGNCGVQVVTWNADDASAITAVSGHVSIHRGETASFDTGENKSLTLRCADYGETLAIVDTGK
jgi:hypothetical protein